MSDIRPIDANALKERVNRTIDYAVDEFDKGYNIGIQKAVELIDNAPTVETKELTPLENKVVEVLPELNNAIVDSLPEIVSKLIKCSECSYYRDTWNIIPRPQGEWINKNPLNRYAECSKCHYWNSISRYCPECGASMKGGAEMRKENDNGKS